MIRLENDDRSRSTTATFTFFTSIVIIIGNSSITITGKTKMSFGMNELRNICVNSFCISTINTLIAYSSLSLNFFSATSMMKLAMPERIAKSPATVVSGSP